MKPVTRILSFGLVAFFALFLMACPVSSKFPLGESGKEKIDKNLLGTWKNDSTGAEATKVVIEKTDDYTYKVTVKEKGSMYMADGDSFKGWLTKIEDKTFFVLQELDTEGSPKDTYYVYCVSVDKNVLTTNDITLKVGGTDAITSTQAYRDEVSASMKQEGFLAGKIVWKK